MKLHSNDKALLMAMGVMLIGAVAYGIHYDAPWSVVLIGGLLSAGALLQKGLPTAAAVFVGGTLISMSASMIFASQIIRLGMTFALGVATAAALWFVAVSPPERRRLTSLLRQPG